jgi:DNA-binding response OmpR family regulator
MARHILIVDDDALMRRSISFKLEQNGYRTSAAGSAEDALALARRDRPDLVLLDIGLPGMDGLEALRHFQKDLDNVPVIFVSARRRELDEILGLELGADSYVTKPFNPDLLLARVKSVLRRSALGGGETAVRPEPITVGDLIIHPAAHTVQVAGKMVDLPAKEFAVLHTLAQEAGYVVTMDDLLNRVWGAEFLGEPQVVYVHVRWIREKIEENPQKPQRLLTVRGVGYKLVPHHARREPQESS